MKQINNAAVEAAQRVISGKDGALFDGRGRLLATMESFQTKMSFNNSKIQPIGQNKEYEINTSHNVSLNFTEIVVQDDKFVDDVLTYQEKGTIPDWSFQGVIQRRGGGEQRYVYSHVIPSGDIDLQNVTGGDVIKRAWSCFVNGKVRRQGKLSVEY
jgi:hypothetical protein